MNKVRVNSYYTYEPVFIDRSSPPFGVVEGILKHGDRVKVINMHGCPKANTMGHCYIQTPNGKFAGLVCTNSLVRPHRMPNMCRR